MSYQRIDRISEEVRREVDAIIRNELQDPRVSGTYSVTRAEVTGDLRYAKIFISVLEDDKRDGLMDALKKAKGYIREGDIFQIVLSNRLSAPFEGSLLNTYRVLRTINPSPYMFYFAGTDVEVAGASPETLVKLENNKRGIYGGAIGYIDFTGNMDTCIAIRIAYKKNGKVFVRSGAGIVADSNPVKEYEECLNKAKSSLKALELAQEVE